MRRREFIGLVSGAAVTWPLAALAQQPTRVAHIGFLGLGPAGPQSSRVKALRAGLRDLGYVEGKNIVIDFRWADRVEQLPELAAELVRINVDVIFATSSTLVEPARQATKTIPIVFATHADPVGIGHVASLSHPGGNITGLTMVLTDLVSKDLEMIKDALPQVARVGILWNPTTPSHPPALRAVEAAATSLGVSLHMVPVTTMEDFDGAFSTMAQDRLDSFLAVASPVIVSQRDSLAKLALAHRLPGIFSTKDNVEAGGLMSYGPDSDDLTRRAALYIVKILNGTKPADLPVEQPTKFELVVNLKTAKALGLKISESFLLRADAVIE
jgi:putative tryptophan/tyrosine transport system substrate-binding protein